MHEYEPMKRIETEAGPVVMTPDGCWFQFESDDDGGVMRLIVQPDESDYAYSHGGRNYRAAIRAIAGWKEANGWEGV